MRFRVTVRADDIELRGYVDGGVTLIALSDALRKLALVVASPAAEDYNPFAQTTDADRIVSLEAENAALLEAVESMRKQQ